MTATPIGTPPERDGASPNRLPRSLSALTGGMRTGTVSDAVWLIRFAGDSMRRVATEIVTGSVSTAQTVVREVSAGTPMSEVFDARVDEARRAAVSALGLAPTTPVIGAARTGNRVSPTALRAQGDAKVANWKSGPAPLLMHPAFPAILNACDDDEARILRFLAVGGPQPSIDVRTKTLFGRGSYRLAAGINMIADMAGCFWPERNTEYLANLNRLGLVRFSLEPVMDFRRYSLLEAQPAVAEAFDRVNGKARTVHRSIYLSLFGKQFCEACFTLAGYTAGGWATNERGDRYFGKGPRLPESWEKAVSEEDLDGTASPTG
ncbi:DUF4393 domain-containing protein [Skermania sp. ID1734]|uniref:Abi-alpha family protein n=1 Tax=Skermania sp. ID1734 TaxID=2597516 RepID=UPI00117E943D|nr:Abi-alpha family protein [Skermania sp. ID1734]TSD98114.1 DUF4393 domain-containing protein [Skermania sp. ID1734]